GLGQRGAGQRVTLDQSGFRHVVLVVISVTPADRARKRIRARSALAFCLLRQSLSGASCPTGCSLPSRPTTAASSPPPRAWRNRWRPTEPPRGCRSADRRS